MLSCSASRRTYLHPLASGLLSAALCLACTGEASDTPGGSGGTAGLQAGGSAAHGNIGGNAGASSAGTHVGGTAGGSGDGGAGNASAGGTGNGGTGNGGTGNAGAGTAGAGGNGGTGNAGAGGTGHGGNAGAGGTGNAGSGNAAGTGNAGAGGTGPSLPGVVGLNGISAWDHLTATEKATVRGHRSFFLHQSVGQDLEDGAEANGFSFEWVASGQSSLAQGLNGGLFSTSNGNPAGKIAEFRGLALRTASQLRVAIMKFGYADIVAGKAAGAQSGYLAAVNDIKAAGVRVLHVTPPFVYNVPSENATKMQTRAWMIQTFPDDVIFDLEDVESTEPSGGARCERGGSWEICNTIRSTSGCPSNSQGVDSASGQGHICYNPHARNIAKAFLYAIYLAAK